jgi:hypothetical protein
LRDIIYSSQRRHNQGVLRHTIYNFRREPVYREIMKYSFRDYFDIFAAPYYQSHGLGLTAAATLDKAGDLRSYGPALHANPDIRVIVNENDFLLADEDLAWLRTTVPANNLTVFSKGGHLGNLNNPTVQKSILAALTPMLPPEQKGK